MYICILMDYFSKGTLQNVLNKCREKKEVIDEEVTMNCYKTFIFP